MLKKVTFRQLMPLVEEAFSKGQSITVPVTGTSMRPSLEPLTDAVTLAAVETDAVVKGDILLYRRKNGAFVLHRVTEVHEDHFDFCGDAQTVIERRIPKRAVLARVIAYERNGVTHDLSEIRKQGLRRLRTRRMRAAATKCHQFRIRWMHRNGSASASKYIFEHIKKHIPLIVAMCIISCVSALSTLGMALASGRIVDKALGHDMNNFRQWFFILFGLLIVVTVCNVLYSRFRVRAVGRMRNEIRHDLFASLLGKDFQSVQELHSGEILNRMTSDIQVVVEGAVSIIPQALSLGTKLIGGLAFLLFVDPTFTLILMAAGISFSVLIRLFSKYYKRLHKECQETEGKTRAFLQECVENLVVVKSFVNEKTVLSKLTEYQNDNFRKQLRRNFVSTIGNTSMYTGVTFAYYAGLAWSVLRIAGMVGSAMTEGTFVTFLQVMEQIRSPFRNASGLLPQWYSMLASADRLCELTVLKEEERVNDAFTISDLYDKMTSIRLEDVVFSYDHEHSVLDHASATFEKDRFTVLLGESGEGKSTLIKLLLGLIRPQSGRILLETKTKAIEADVATRNLFAYVPQGNMILSGTLAENIMFGNSRVTANELNEAARFACLDRVIEELPQGFDTVIGERGVGLSEGQIQRVAIARAYLSPAPILLLDECTSALDEKTEWQLLQHLKALRNRTVLFISHRPAVLKVADRILVLKDKRISERIQN